MKKIGEALKKEQIAGCKGYMRWYRVMENELRLFVNERLLTESGEKVNLIYHRENRAILCADGYEYSKNFCEKFKGYDVRVYIKADSGALYNEFAVKSWGLCDRGVEVIFE